MNLRPFWTVPVVLTAALVTTAYPVRADREGAVDTVRSATAALQSMMANPSTRIPPWVLRNAQAIAVFPQVIKAGFIFGGSGGKGIILLRRADGGWTNPAFITISSGSFGLQFGAQSSNIILVFRNRHSVRTILTNDFTLGGSVSGTAGPVGSQAVAVNDAQQNTDIYSYAQSKGLFGGVTLEGSKIAVDQDRNAEFYGRRGITVQQIFNGNLPTYPVVARFDEVLDRAVAGRG